MDKFLGTQSTDAAIAQYAMNLPDVKQAMKYTDDDFKENFQYYIGRQPTTGELASMKKAKITNFNQMRNFLQQQPAYLKNLNAVAQQSFAAQQKSAEDALAEQARLSASLTPEQVSTAYRDALGRQPTMDELRQYMGAQQTQEGLAGVLKGTPEYLTKLTQPLVPTPSAPKYAPGTVYWIHARAEGGYRIGRYYWWCAAYAVRLAGSADPWCCDTGRRDAAESYVHRADGIADSGFSSGRESTCSCRLACNSQLPSRRTCLDSSLMVSQPQGSPQSIEAMLAALRAQQQQGVTQMADGGYAGGGYHLGDYSDGGRLLKGPGNGS
jgi:hypothetical protein